ncbi:AEC family transporter [candidate division KSB1 bacterium]|nr:AEC family transporter [candidate division KSB1 bacterium]RQW06077.1 MAG: AEC family transporter [candidate division KSB1 bacterium]
MQNLIFSGTIVAPVFIIVFLGVLLRRHNIIDDSFSRITSRMVFNVAMPALLFQKLSAIPIEKIFNLYQILFVIGALCFMFAFAWIVSLFMCRNGADQGAFIQGSFRGNFAILGLALISNAFGAEALAKGALVLAVIMPLYNILSIIALTVPMHRERSTNPQKIALQIVTNPLILAAVLALPFSIFQIPIHSVVTQTIDYLADLTLPLALIGIGSSLSFSSVRQDRTLSIMATMIKIIIMPLLGTSVAVLLGFRGEDLGILYFLFAAPTAIASYIMAHALGSNGRLAGNIVLVSTITSMITISAGIYVLKSLGYF